MPLGYELIADTSITSNTTQVDFTGLSISSDDEILLVSDIVNPLASTVSYYLYANNNNTATNYQRQGLLTQLSVLSTFNANDARIAQGYNTSDLICNSRIKLTENNYLAHISKMFREFDTGGYLVYNFSGSSLVTFTSITTLSVVAATTNGIGSGSRFKLYKLNCELLADTTLASNSTQVDITGLSFDETNELLLVCDLQNGTASNANVELFFNNDTTSTNYYKQEFSADGSTVSSSRSNDAIITRLDATNGDTVAMIKVKLTNASYPTAQADSVREVANSGINALTNSASKTGTVTSITQLNIKASVTNALGIGSRFKLYKLK